MTCTHDWLPSHHHDEPDRCVLCNVSRYMVSVDAGGWYPTSPPATVDMHRVRCSISDMTRELDAAAFGLRMLAAISDTTRRQRHISTIARELERFSRNASNVSMRMAGLRFMGRKNDHILGDGEMVAGDDDAGEMP